MLSFLPDACVFIAPYSCFFFTSLHFQRRALGRGVIETLPFRWLFFFSGTFFLIGSGPCIMCENFSGSVAESVLRRGGGGTGLAQPC